MTGDGIFLVMVFYCARITSIDEYRKNDESAGGALYGTEQAIRIEWVQDNMAMYDEALGRVTRKDESRFEGA
jgi:hypothetical protein